MPQTITGELRKWHHDVNSNGEKCVVGKMYYDTRAIYDDGEDAVIFYTDWYESSTYYLAINCKFDCVKCPKDEEIVYEARTHNGGSGNVG